MRKSIHFLAASTAVCLTALVTALPASATCTRLAFSVNDYGKDGPTKDAKRLLDPYIAKWAKEHGIKKYTTGSKNVSCELFLNFILFDEHTCKADANVCWDGPAVPGMPGVKPETAAVAPSTSSPKPKATTTGSIEKPAADKAADVPKKDEAKVSKPETAAKSDASSKKESYEKVPDPSEKSAKSDAAAATDAAKSDAPPKKLVRSAAKIKPKADAKAAEAVKPKAPLPEKPESAPVQ